MSYFKAKMHQIRFRLGAVYTAIRRWTFSETWNLNVAGKVVCRHSTRVFVAGAVRNQVSSPQTWREMRHQTSRIVRPQRIVLNRNNCTVITIATAAFVGRRVECRRTHNSNRPNTQYLTRRHFNEIPADFLRRFSLLLITPQAITATNVQTILVEHTAQVMTSSTPVNAHHWSVVEQTFQTCHSCCCYISLAKNSSRIGYIPKYFP